MKALISFRTYSGLGVKEIHDFLTLIRSTGAVLKISSVYKIKPIEIQTVRKQKNAPPLGVEGFISAILIDTTVSPQDLLFQILEIEERMQKSKHYSTVIIRLLVIENVLLNHSALTLPHPDLHLNLEELVPAVEIWPEYVHPILNLKLAELLKMSKPVTWGEFYCQGPSLIDFSARND